MSNNGNEAAFPRVTSYEHPDDFDNFRDVRSDGGLSKREWFAGLAMQGMLAGFATETDIPHQHIPVTIASFSVMCADALLAELAKEPAP